MHDKKLECLLLSVSFALVENWQERLEPTQVRSQLFTQTVGYKPCPQRVSITERIKRYSLFRYVAEKIYTIVPFPKKASKFSQIFFDLILIIVSNSPFKLGVDESKISFF